MVPDTPDPRCAAAFERPLQLRARTDLEAIKLRYRRRTYWHIKDPVTLRFYQLREEEYFILNLLDGRRSLSEIQRRVEEQFTPQRVELRHLQAFVGMLQIEGLTLADSDRQGSRLLDQRGRLQRREWFAALTNPLAIRFRGVDPGRVLDLLHPHVSWLYRPPVLLATALLLLAAVAHAVMHFSALQARLPSVQSFLTVTNVAWLAASLFCIKLLHELAHGLTCHHFGARCHEAGVMLLVGVPCLYCNVSDAWMIPGKWKRMAISAAGIWLELTLASACFFLWWFAAPGVFSAVCFNVVVVCSMGTLLLNGNPLLRFDGYYLLADWIEIPNLWQQATGYLKQNLAKLVLGIDWSPGRMVEGDCRIFLVVYAVLSLIYRIIVVSGILWLCLSFFSYHRLAPLGQLLVTAVLGGFVITWTVQWSRRLRDPRLTQHLLKARAIAPVACVFLVVAALVLIPLPRRVKVPVMVVPARAERVFVTNPGIVQWTVTAGQAISRGQPVAVLRDVRLEHEIEKVTQLLELQNLVVDQLQRRRIRDPRAGNELPAAQELRDALSQRLDEQILEHKKLTPAAPRDGVVIAPRARATHQEPTELPVWSGTPLDPENAGCFLDADTLVCLVGDPNEKQALAIVEQQEVAAIRAGQVARLWFDAAPGKPCEATLEEVERIDFSEVPPELIASKKLAVGNEGQPATTSYRALLSMGETTAPLPIGATGVAHIYVGRESLLKRASRALLAALQFSTK